MPKPTNPTLVRIAQILAAGSAYFLACRLGLIYPFVANTATLVSPAAGVAFAAVWSLGEFVGLGIALGAFLAHLSLGQPLLLCGLTAIGSVLAPILARRLLLTKGNRLDLFSNPTNLSYFLSIAVALTPTVSATCGALALWLTDRLTLADTAYAWVVWWSGEAVGVLIVAPALLSWRELPPLSRSLSQWSEFALLLASFFVLVHLIFVAFGSAQVAPLSFGILPIVVWASLRFPPFVLHQMVLAMATAAVVATIGGHGAFALGEFHKNLLLLHTFLTAVASVGLILNASIQAFRHSIRHANETAERRAKQQGALMSLINEDLLLHGALNAVLAELIETSAWAIAVQRVGFRRMSPDFLQLQTVACFDRDHGLSSESNIWHREQYPSFFQAIQDSKLVVAENAYEHPQTREFADHYLVPKGIGSILAVPVRLFGTLLGVLCLEHVGPPKPWRDDEQVFAVAMANLVATAHEHDERRRAEASLQLAVTAFETSEGIMITDANANILRVNQAACVITGYESQELVGANTRMLQSERHRPGFYRVMWEELLEEGHWAGEVWNRRRDGSVYPQWMSTNVVRNHKGEISHLVSTFIDISERKRTEGEIARLVHYDCLTGLPNRRLIMERLEHAFHMALQGHGHSVLMFVDLDHFKHLNDALGHIAGDQVLVDVADRLRAICRSTDLVGRLGGDEFLLLLDSRCDSAEAARLDAKLMADRILGEINRPVDLAGQHYHVGASIGITVFPGNCNDVADVLRQADTAMYRAKEVSRNAVRFFEWEMQATAEKRLDIDRALREALRTDQLSIHLQPQIAPDGQYCGAEVLARWNRPGHGWVGPEVFVPIAEESGLICELGDWVLNQACRTIAGLQAIGQPCDIAVNVSPRQFRQSDFAEKVKMALANGSANAHRLILELTENALIDDLDDAVQKMTELGALGVRFSIDDFGTGYSSLSYLHKLPVSEIKIDRSFVSDVITDRGDAAIVDAILAMAQRLDLKVVAEGVETAEQLTFLKSRGCRYFQGFFYSRPLTWEDFMAQFRSAAEAV